MNRHRVALAALPLLLVLAACGTAASPAQSAEAVATVNGKPLSKSEFDLYMQNVQQQSQRRKARA